MASHKLDLAISAIETYIQKDPDNSLAKKLKSKLQPFRLHKPHHVVIDGVDTTVTEIEVPSDFSMNVDANGGSTWMRDAFPENHKDPEHHKDPES